MNKFIIDEMLALHVTYHWRKSIWNSIGKRIKIEETQNHDFILHEIRTIYFLMDKN